MPSSFGGIYRIFAGRLKEPVSFDSSFFPFPVLIQVLLHRSTLSVAAALLPAVAFSPCPGQQLPPDTIVPIPLPSLEVKILLSPLQARNAPHAVSILREADLPGAAAGIFMAGALQALPGLQIQNRFNLAVGEKVTIRGQGARAQFGVRGIRVLVDDIPATLPDGQSTLDHLDLRSLGQVELARGPASALYGNGAGGVLRFETRAPPDVPLSEAATLTAGSRGYLQVSSITSGKLERTGYLVSVGSGEYGSYRDNPLEPEGVFGSAHRRIFNGQIRRELESGGVTLTMNVVDLDSENPGSVSRSLLETKSREARDFNVTQQTGEDVTQGQLGISWSGSLRNWDARLAGFGLFRDVRARIPPAVIDLERKAGGIRGHIGGNAGDEDFRLRWTAGAEVGFQDDGRRNFQNQEGTAGSLTLDQREEVSGSGIFLQGLLTASQGANLLAGIRYDRTAFRVEDGFKGVENPDDSGHRVLDAVSPSLGLSIPLTQGLVASASISTFFQTPTTSEMANQPSGAGGFNPTLDPQTGTTLEAGFRVFRNGRLQAEATLFHTRIRSELVPYEVPGAPGRVYFQNAGRSLYQGLELSGTFQLARGFRLRSAYTFLDATYREFAPDQEDLSGNRIPGVSRHAADGILSWGGTPFGDRRPVSVEIRLRRQGSVFVDDRNTDEAPAYSLVDLHGGFGGIGVGATDWEPFFGITNLLDRYYVTSVSVNAFGGRFFDPGPPRGFYVGMTATFGLEKEM